jgi:hypothetical protein
MWTTRGRKKEQNKVTANGFTTPLAVAAVATASTVDVGNEENPYSEYSLGSPPKGNKSVSLEVALKKIKSDSKKLGRIVKDARKEGATNETKAQAKMIVFLYGRGFMLGNKKKKRKLYVKEMIKSDNGNSERLLRVLEANGDNDLSNKPEYRDQYANLRLSLKRYFDLPDTFGFLPDMSDAQYYFRFQKRGNCYLQAPCVMAAYLKQKNNGNASPNNGNASPVDVSKYVRHSFTDAALYDYVVKNDGGQSLAVMTTITCALSNDPSAHLDTVSAQSVLESDLRDIMSKSGPGLVSNFQTHKRFKRPADQVDKIGIVQFDGHPSKKEGKPSFIPLGASVPTEEEKAEITDEIEIVFANSEDSGSVLPTPTILNRETSDEHAAQATTEGDLEGGKKDKQDRHAMVLIGGRLEGKKQWLLLQNWWDEMPLVEVSAVYFKNSGGYLGFIPKGTLDSFSDSFESIYSLNASPIAESNNLDKPDRLERSYQDDVDDRLDDIDYLNERSV